MSLENWKSEFYPTPATGCTTEPEAVEHSIKKWEGLTKDNLSKHDVKQHRSVLYGVADTLSTLNRFNVNMDTCALCQRHMTEKKLFDGSLYYTANCEACVLYTVRGVGCDELTEDEDDANMNSDCDEYLTPYNSFIWKGNPQPMLDLLKEAREYLLCQQTNSTQNKQSSSDSSPSDASTH